MKYPTHGASVRAALVHRFLKASRASVVFVTARGYEPRQRGSIKSIEIATWPGLTETDSQMVQNDRDWPTFPETGHRYRAQPVKRATQLQAMCLQ